jgi:hypothetical protein
VPSNLGLNFSPRERVEREGLKCEVALGELRLQALKLLMSLKNEKARGSFGMPEGWKKGLSLVFAFLEVE